MSKITKLIGRLGSRPKDFEWSELVKVLSHFEFEQYTKGKTSGSRRVFIRAKDKAINKLHEPHPEKVLKPYAIKLVIVKLKELKLL